MKVSLFIFSVFLLVNCRPSEGDLESAPIIPKPVLVESGGDYFEIDKSTDIFIDGHSPSLNAIAQYLQKKLRPAMGFTLKIKTISTKPETGIYFTQSADASLGEEGYQISISEDLIVISCYKPAGAFIAVQTIRQLLPPSIERNSKQSLSWKIATGKIVDTPSYSYRGVMLDVARHFFSVAEVKKFIDLIAAYKINVLHLHLSDDQGWRIEIKSWPNLTAHGGKTEVGGGKGGFYTQEQYKEIIQYAQENFITIIPEIDMPGHINSALASYGELNGGTIVPAEGRVAIEATTNKILDGKTKPTELYTGIRVGWSTLRLEKKSTFQFVEDVVREISAITPGPYFHIGGDEAQVTKKEDYIKFINRFREIVKANGKKMIGWEEIAQADINEDVVTQHWNATKYAIAANEKGSKLIMSPAKKAYLDMSYDSTSKFGLHWAAYIEVDSAYQWSPSKIIDEISKENVLGIEAPLWSETISNMDEVEYLLFPRLLGYAEIGWSKEENRNWNEYKIRLGKHAPRFEAQKINFYKSNRVPWANSK